MKKIILFPFFFFFAYSAQSQDTIGNYLEPFSLVVDTASIDSVLLIAIDPEPIPTHILHNLPCYDFHFRKSYRSQGFLVVVFSKSDIFNFRTIIKDYYEFFLNYPRIPLAPVDAIDTRIKLYVFKRGAFSIDTICFDYSGHIVYNGFLSIEYASLFDFVLSIVHREREKHKKD